MAISHEVSKSGSGLDTTTADASKDSDDSAVKGKEVELLFSRGIIKSLLSLLRTKLTRDSWKKQPSAKHAFVWTLRQLKVHVHVHACIDYSMGRNGSLFRATYIVHSLKYLRKSEKETHFTSP